MSGTTTSETVSESINQSGLLFQQPPGIGEWKATRAMGPEIAAFVNQSLEQHHRLSIVYHREGEVDEDGYKWENDTWVIHATGLDIERPYPSFTDRENAVARLEKLMKKQ
jgi:hypothetical protein